MRAFAACVLIALAGCASMNFNDSLGAAYLTADWVARTARELCGNVDPGGPCAPGSVINDDQMDKARKGVGEALQTLDSARQFKLDGEYDAAKQELAEARATLIRLKDWLEGLK